MCYSLFALLPGIICMGDFVLSVMGCLLFFFAIDMLDFVLSVMVFLIFLLVSLVC